LKVTNALAKAIYQGHFFEVHITLGVTALPDSLKQANASSNRHIKATHLSRHWNF